MNTLRYKLVAVRFVDLEIYSYLLLEQKNKMNMQCAITAKGSLSRITPKPEQRPIRDTKKCHDVS